MKQLVLKTDSPEATMALGEKIAALVEPGELLTLSGQLGAGKTTFTKGLAKGLGISRNVTSPTFTLLKSYKGRMTLHHIDAYRLEGLNQDLGFEEYFDSDGLCVIEWSGFIADQLPSEKLEIEFAINDDGSRNLTFTAYGQPYERILDSLCTQ